MTDDKNDGSAEAPNKLDKGQFLLGFAGLAFIYGAVFVLGMACYRLFTDFRPVRNIYEYNAELIMCAVGAFASLLGVQLLKSVGLTKNQQPSRVINEKEWDVICDKVREGSEEAISQYIRLTSLTGFTGTFTKLGLTGLPLATIGLTIFFSVLSLWYPDTFLDLAKLTLGAFIGSFVQKQVGASQGGSIKLATGETVKVRPTEDY
jgi:hypothetical protein